MSGKVIIVSNRLPVNVKKDHAQIVFSYSIGGLATGLSSYISSRSGNLWVGWPGIASDGLTNDDKKLITNKLIRQGYVPIWLSQKQIDNFYNGFSNSLIWPIFHGLSFKATDTNATHKWWQSYKAVNKLYGDTIANLIDGNSQVWIHDYHLMLLPSYVRQTNNLTHVGFFMHIPFPEPKVFDNLIEAKAILKGMLGADLIGFHTKSYTANFLDTIKQHDLGQVTQQSIKLTDREIRVSAFPMGIDYNKFANSSQISEVKKLSKNYSKKYRRQKIIASVDRLDPSKGLIERLKAYDKYLATHPKSLGKVVFVMVAAPSRTDIADYQKLSKQLISLVEKINLNYAFKKWRPIDYINEPIPFEHVSALFQIADIAFITPIKDGMNLAAKEFVASNRKNGVLILSSGAGAAEELTGAIITDTNKPEDLTKALDLAMTMRKKELKNRLKIMRAYLSTHTVNDWAKSFMDSLNQPLQGTPRITYSLNLKLQQRLVKDYKKAGNRLILLDYDGSLLPFTPKYQDAAPSKKIVQLLKKLADDQKNVVVLISGRKAEDLEKWFGKLKINLVAEHGAVLRLNRADTWQNAVNLSSNWQKFLLPTLEKYASMTPGAEVEIKPHSLVWHYRNASAYQAQKNIVILKRALKPVLKKHDLVIVQGNKIIEIRSSLITKGNAIQRWLNVPYDFILAIGDDTTDEDLFKTLPGQAYSIKVGRGLSFARYRLLSTEMVIQLLAKFP